MAVPFVINNKTLTSEKKVYEPFHLIYKCIPVKLHSSLDELFTLLIHLYNCFNMTEWLDGELEETIASRVKCLLVFRLFWVPIPLRSTSFLDRLNLSTPFGIKNVSVEYYTWYNRLASPSYLFLFVHLPFTPRGE